MNEVGFIKTAKGEDVLTYEYIQHLRDLDRKKSNPLKIIAQRGCQEKFLASNADITIFGGSRGGGKSWAILMEALKDVNNRYMNAIVTRSEKKDMDGLIDKSMELFSQYGKYNRSQSDMTWNFYKGGKLGFTYLEDSISDFVKRFQGKEYCYIAIDEITHTTYEKFKYLITDNRNAYGLRNRFYGTCNPDPDSWVRIFIDWWIGEDGFPIEERDGVKRYCFMAGDNPNSILWGNTRHEVYLQAKDRIDRLWKPEFDDYGFTKEKMFVKSVTFIKGKLEENAKLLLSSPEYLANLSQRDEESVSRDLEGNWNFKNAGDDMIKMRDMERFFAAPYNYDDNRHRASCDIAFTGGDSLVMWHWVGWHIEDIFVIRMDAKTVISAVKYKLQEWGVLEEDFTYDLNGLGQTFRPNNINGEGYFPKAIPFNNLETPFAVSKNEEASIKYMYANIKSQCAYLFARKLIQGEISINENLLDLKFSGDGFDKMPLRQILMKERKCIRQNEETADKGFALIPKKIMKKYVGHSPDYFESLLMRMIFTLKKQYKKPKGLWKL